MDDGATHDAPQQDRDRSGADDTPSTSTPRKKKRKLFKAPSLASDSEEEVSAADAPSFDTHPRTKAPGPYPSPHSEDDNNGPLDPDYAKPNWTFYTPPDDLNDSPRPSPQPSYNPFARSSVSEPHKPGTCRTWIHHPAGGFLHIPPHVDTHGDLDKGNEMQEERAHQLFKHCAYHPDFRLWTHQPVYTAYGGLVWSDEAVQPLVQRPGLLLKAVNTLFCVHADKLLVRCLWERSYLQRLRDDWHVHDGMPVLDVHPDITPIELEHYLTYVVYDKGALVTRLPVKSVLVADFDAALAILKISTYYADVPARTTALAALKHFFPSSAERPVSLHHLPLVHNMHTMHERAHFQRTYALRAVPILQAAAAHAHLPTALYAAAQQPVPAIVASPAAATILEARDNLAHAFRRLIAKMLTLAFAEAQATAMAVGPEADVCGCNVGRGTSMDNLRRALDLCVQVDACVTAGWSAPRIDMLVRPEDLLVPRPTGNHFCGDCREALSVALERWEDAAWELLPSVCGYANWAAIHAGLGKARCVS